jgi:hypothetical protein
LAHNKEGQIIGDKLFFLFFIQIYNNNEVNFINKTSYRNTVYKIFWDILTILFGAFYIYLIIYGIIKKKIISEYGYVFAKKNIFLYIFLLIMYGFFGVMFLVIAWLSILKILV